MPEILVGYVIKAFKKVMSVGYQSCCFW